MMWIVYVVLSQQNQLILQRLKFVGLWRVQGFLIQLFPLISLLIGSFQVWLNLNLLLHLFHLNIEFLSLEMEIPKVAMIFCTYSCAVGVTCY
uniref:Uncharacterized protein n=1 Tax=Cucumis melo TaxID=3656 RepID=A0A9I9E5H7_CUCME